MSKDDHKHTVIIKKRKGDDHGLGHSDSWKVAYADFVTAMMAFFLALWLMSMTAPEKRARVAHYFRHFSIFDKGGQTFLDKKANSILQDKGSSSDKVFAEMYGAASGKTSREAVRNAIKEAIEKKLGDVKDQVILDVFEGGIRIQLVDKKGKPMFKLGSAEPTELAKRILRIIAEKIRSLPNHVVIEGHTDALPYQSEHYTNWDLSTERALAAMRVLKEFGFNPKKLEKLAGFADTSPLIKENPRDPRNRRISILVLFEKKDGDSSPLAHDIFRGGVTIVGAPPRAAPHGAAPSGEEAPSPDAPPPRDSAREALGPARP